MDQIQLFWPGTLLDWWTKVCFLNSRFTLGIWWTRFCFKTSRFARGHSWTRFCTLGPDPHLVTIWNFPITCKRVYAYNSTRLRAYFAPVWVAWKKLSQYFSVEFRQIDISAILVISADFRDRGNLGIDSKNKNNVWVP